MASEYIKAATRQYLGVRTVYRDLEALYGSGFPLFCERVDRVSRYDFVVEPEDPRLKVEEYPQRTLNQYNAGEMPPALMDGNLWRRCHATSNMGQVFI